MDQPTLGAGYDYTGAQIAFPIFIRTPFRTSYFQVINNTGATLYISRTVTTPSAIAKDITIPPRFSYVVTDWHVDQIYIGSDSTSIGTTDSLTIQAAAETSPFSAGGVPVAGFTPYLSQFSWAGKQFPFDGGAPDITIAVNTTWSDANAYKQVGTLTIAAGVTLTIGVSPFIVFARRVVFGNATSRITISGKGGFPGDANANFGRGGGFLALFVGEFAGANGTISADGTIGHAVATTISGGQGALSANVGNLGARESFNTWANVLANNPDATARLLTGLGGGSGGVSGTDAGGGSGVGAGGFCRAALGGGSSTGINAGTAIQLLLAGCIGGGGGASGNTGNAGGGGGCVLCISGLYSANPTITALGGANAGGTSVGGVGLTFKILLT